MDMIDDGAQPLFTWLDFHNCAREIIEKIRAANVTITGVFAIPRGGLCLASVIANAFAVPITVGYFPESSTPTSVLAVDDSTCTGGSLVPFARHGMPCAVLVKHPQAPAISPFFYAIESDELYLFPWECEAEHELRAVEEIVIGWSEFSDAPSQSSDVDASHEV